MNRALTFLFALCIFNFAFGEDLYLRKAASGTATGADWNNAWTDWNQVQWGSGAGKLSPGDTLWIAGGTYTSGLTPSAGGTSGSRIFVKRVRTTDSVPAAAAGWNASYDAQVVMAPITFSGTAHLSEWITFDGQVENGIKISVPNGTAAGVNWPSASMCNLTFTNLEVAGPAGASAFTYANDLRGFDLTAWNGTAWQEQTNIVVDHCWVHGCVDLLYFANVKYSTFDNNLLTDCWAANSATYHENVLLTLVSTDINFRNNMITNWATEGIEMGYAHARWTITGNILVAGPAGPYRRALETQYQESTDIYVANNVFIGLWLCIYNDNSGGSWSTSTLKNNVFINSPLGNIGAGWDRDYNAFDTSNTETHGLANITTAVFQNYAQMDYRAKTNLTGVTLRQAGVDLGTDTDRAGTSRDADGAWTIGAYAIIPPGQGDPPPDTTPPTISDVSAGIPGQTTATITWTTSESATAGVKYGLTSGYGSTTTNGNSFALSQSVALSGLSAGTTYHFQVWTSDTSFNTASNLDGTFNTAAAPSGITLNAVNANFP